MDLLIHHFPAQLIGNQEKPCISLYQETHRTHPENQADRICFKDLVKSIENQLKKEYAAEEVGSLLKPFHLLEGENEFWTHMQKGLAIFATSNFFKIYKLARSVPAVAMVGDTFYLKPLIRILQSAERYQILGLNRQQAKLFEGNRDGLELVNWNDEVPNTLEKALGRELTPPHLTVASYGTGTVGPAMHHGQGGKKDEVHLDTHKFFHIIDEGVLKYHSQPTHLPLILAALPEHQGIFHQLSHNPYLLSEGINSYYDEISLEELRSQAWKIIEPRYLQSLNNLIEQFSQAQAKNKGSDNLEEVAKAAVSGRIATLLMDSDYKVPGNINTETGNIEKENIANDLIDEIGELVIQSKGQVIVIPREKMPTKTGVAAIYRY